MCTNTRPNKQHVLKVPLLEACLGLRADLITVGETGVGVLQSCYLLKVALPERHRARCMLAPQTVRGAGWTVRCNNVLKASVKLWTSLWRFYPLPLSR